MKTLPLQCVSRVVRRNKPPVSPHHLHSTRSTPNRCEPWLAWFEPQRSRTAVRGRLGAPASRSDSMRRSLAPRNVQCIGDVAWSPRLVLQNNSLVVSFDPRCHHKTYHHIHHACVRSHLRSCEHLVTKPQLLP